VQTFEGALARIPQCQFLQVGRSNLSEASQQVLMVCFPPILVLHL
jgi:hypothetical protein